ncbi:MAG: Fe-S cluster assembly protein SufD [Pseudolabrys sp.]
MADVTPMKTPAEQALSAAYEAARGTLPGKDGIATLRDGAFKQFAERGLPHRRVEEWKYTDLRALMREANPLAPAPDAKAKDRAKDAGNILASVDTRKLVFVDGVFAPEMSDLAPEEGSDLAPEEGLTIGTLADALAKGDKLVAEHLGKTFATDDVAVALNTALMGDGAVIEIAKGAEIKRPIHLIFATGTDKPSAVFVRSLVVVGEGAKATIIEDHDSGDAQVNTGFELKVGDGAQVDYFKVTKARALHVASLLAEIGAKANFNTFAYTADSALVRNQNFVRFAGEHSHGGIRGVSLERGKEHVDTTLLIEHAAAHCDSREQFKAVLDDESHGVFQGKIIVKPGAQKTDAKMMTRALLLTDEAEADAKPELEIFADDVVCGHGATTSAPDKGLKFYLMSRGITEPEAEALLIQAFIGEVVEEIGNEAIREALMNAAIDWMKERST